MRQWTVGFYGDRVFPRVMNVMCNTKESRRIRADVCAPLVGEVLEIGFGTGLNLPHLPPSVDRLLAVDPLQRGRDLAGARLAESHVTVDFVGLDGQSLELEGDSVDAALSTWTLCTIPDAIAVVREIGRVLRPGGTFHFVEEQIRRLHAGVNGGVGLVIVDGRPERLEHRCCGAPSTANP